MAHIKHPIWASIPRDNGTVSVAANQGVPLVISGQKSPVAKGISNLAKMIRTETIESEKTSEGARKPAGETKSKTILGKIFS